MDWLSFREVRALLGRTLCTVMLGAAGAVAALAGAPVQVTASDQCGLSGQPPCLTVSDVAPRLLTKADQTVTLTGTSLDQVTAVHLLPDGFDVDFRSVDFSTLRVTLPRDLSPGSYRLEVVGAGGTARTDTISFLESASGQVVRPSYAPATAPATAAAKPPVASAVAPSSARPTSWGLIVTAGVLAGALAAACLGVWWRLLKRRRYREMDDALNRLWGLDEDADKERIDSLLQWRRRPPRRTLTDPTPDQRS